MLTGSSSSPPASVGYHADCSSGARRELQERRHYHGPPTAETSSFEDEEIPMDEEMPLTIRVDRQPSHQSRLSTPSYSHVFFSNIELTLQQHRTLSCALFATSVVVIIAGVATTIRPALMISHSLLPWFHPRNPHTPAPVVPPSHSPTALPTPSSPEPPTKNPQTAKSNNENTNTPTTNTNETTDKPVVSTAAPTNKPTQKPTTHPFTTPPTQPKGPVIPGTELITSTTNLLTHQRLAPLFVTDLSQNRATQDRKWTLPSGVLMSKGGCSCSLFPSTYLVSNLEEYIRTQSTDFRVEGKLWHVSGSSRATFLSAKEGFNRQNKCKVVLAAVKCENYRLVNVNPKLDPMVVATIKRLPRDFNDDTQISYQSLFTWLGTHVITNCVVGGRLEKDVFVDSAYATSHSRESIEQDASLLFLSSLTKSPTYRDQLSDKDFLLHSNTTTLDSFGGDFPHGTETLKIWSTRIQQGNGLVCVEWMAYPITNFFDLDPSLAPWKPAVQSAIDSFYQISGCTNSHATNYNPRANHDDGSCVVPPDEPCSEIGFADTPNPGWKNPVMIGDWQQPGDVKKSHVWIFENDAAHECVIAWAYGKGTLGVQSSVGKGHVHRDNAQLTMVVKRSDDFGEKCDKDHYIHLSVSDNGCPGNWQCSKPISLPAKTVITPQMTFNTWGSCNAPFAVVGWVSESRT